MTTEVKSITPETWQELRPPSIFHSWDYARLDALTQPGTPTALLITHASKSYLYVFHLVPHGKVGAYTTSPYGYGDILPLDRGTDLALVNALIDDWMEEHGVFAEFCRGSFHGKTPLREGQSFVVRTNVSLDLTQGGQPRSSSARRNAKLAFNRGYQFLVDQELQHLDTFMDLYTHTMKRLGAEDFYFFPRQYIEGLLTTTNTQLFHLSHPKHGVVASALGFASGDTFFYHLAGVSSDHFRDRPLNGLLAGMARVATELGCKTLFLGGGTTNDPGDNLFVFKSRIGQIQSPSYIVTKVHDQDRYQEITSQWQAKNPRSAQAHGKKLLGFTHLD